jgi:ketosteroid isomerase-like protein
VSRPLSVRRTRISASGAGRPYNNRYCIVARFADGKIQEMTDHVGTGLITAALVP